MRMTLSVFVLLACLLLASAPRADEPPMEGTQTIIYLANGLGSACEGELDLASQALCFARLAKVKKDLSICEKIPDERLEDGCYSDLAALRSDPDICQRITKEGVKDSCYFKLAKVKADRALCNWIEDQGLRDGCMENLTAGD